MSKLFSELGLSAEVLKAIDKLGFEQVAPIQADTIPLLLAGRDVAGQSETGSGKTLAFAVPAIEKTDPALRAVQVLILCPTRELAMQVAEEFHKLALFKRRMHILPIYGGQSYERQFLGLRQGAQIIIGTPGRIMDHMRRGTLRLDKVKMLILDEVDVMLDMGFRDDIETILKEVPEERQTVFFSATIPSPIQDLIRRFARDPQHVRLERKELTVPTVKQVYYEVDRRFKMELLTRLIDLHDLNRGIIFCNTKRMVDDLVDHLNAFGYSADRLHGDMSQAMRDRVMHKFRNSGLEMLVATDVAARGIDVEHVQVVFNYDLPYDVEDYLHRIGRTGRAGRSGLAISFAAGRELFQIHHIERFTRVKIQRGKAPTAQEVEEARTNVFLDKLRATLESGEFKRQDHAIERLLEEGFSSTDIASALLHHLQIATGVQSNEPLLGQQPGSRPKHRERPEREARHSAGEERNAPRTRHVAAPVGIPSSKQYPVKAEERNQPTPQPGCKEERIPAEGRSTASPPSQEKPVKPQRATPPNWPSAQAAPVAGKHSAPPAIEQRLLRKRPREVGPRHSPKHSRRTPAEQTRLFLNVGEEMGVKAGDVVGTILGETGLAPEAIGAIDIRKRHLFVDVASEHANAILSKLNRTQIKGQKLRAKVA